MLLLPEEEKRIIKRKEILNLLDVALNKCYGTLPAEEYDSIMSARNFLQLSNELDLERIITNKKAQLNSIYGEQHEKENN